MSGARQQILLRIRTALNDVSAIEQPADVPVPREYLTRPVQTKHELLERFEHRLRDYGAGYRHVSAAEIAGGVATACAELSLRTLVIPPGLPAEWRPNGVELVEDHSLSTEAIDQLDGALTGCAAAIAETGTLLLDSRGASGRRVITLVPDHHICVVNLEQLVGSVPEALSRVSQSVIEHRSPVTLISGPSATSDIELTRVVGVHGPRHLSVVIVDGEPS